eukprot:scaffold35099_cov57-Phaeocystis_antarctica.AAC.1
MDFGLLQLRLIEVGPLQLGPIEVGLLQLRPKEVGPLQLHLTEDGLLQLRPTEVGPLQPSTHQIGTLFACASNRRQTLDPLLPETRGKLVPHRIGTHLCPALQLDGVGRHNRFAILGSAQEEPGHAPAWLQAGRTQRYQLFGCLVQPPFLTVSLLAIVLLAILLAGRPLGSLSCWAQRSSILVGDERPRPKHPRRLYHTSTRMQQNERYRYSLKGEYPNPWRQFNMQALAWSGVRGCR